MKDGVLERGVLKTTADMFSVHKSTMGRFWREINNEIIRCHGDNNYKVPHLGKERLDRRGELPTVLPVIEEALDLL